MTEDLVVSAYQKERFTMTLTEVEERATGRRRMRWAPALAAGLAIVTAVTSWQLLAGKDKTAPIGGSTEFAAACKDPLNRTNIPLHTLNGSAPTERFSFTHGDNGLRIYANEKVLLECVLADHGVVQAGALYSEKSRLYPTNQAIRYFAHHGKSGSANYLVGEVPPKMTKVTATLASGETVEAQIAGDLFAIWHPTGSLVGARVSASNAAGPGPSAAAPSQPGGVFNEPAFDEACRNDISARNIGVSAAGLEEVKGVNSWQGQALAYVTDRSLFLCHSSEMSFGHKTGHRDGTNELFWSTAKPLENLMVWGRGAVVLVGRSPVVAGRGRIRVETGDGRIIEAMLHGTLFIASWSADVGDNDFEVGPQIPPKITATTVTHTYTRTNDSITVVQPN